MYDDATGQGKQIATLHSQAQGVDPTGFARGFVPVENGNKLMFVAQDGTATLNRLWITDGNVR